MTNLRNYNLPFVRITWHDFLIEILMFTNFSLRSLLLALKDKFPIRLVLSVIAGIAISTILSAITHEILYLAGIFPSPMKPLFDTRLLLISLVYHSLYAVGAAFVTAMIAKEKAKKAVFFLGSKEAIMWLLGTLLLWKHTPAWFNITKAVVGIPLAMFGGKIYATYKQKKTNANKNVVSV